MLTTALGLPEDRDHRSFLELEVQVFSYVLLLRSSESVFLNWVS